MGDAERGNVTGDVYDRDHLPPGFSSVEAWFGACRRFGLDAALYQPGRGIGWRVPVAVWMAARGCVPSPPSLDTLRQKLDAAIVAEAWDAVKAIRERIVDLEREQAGNVVALHGKGVRA